jgi:hypothetical protein
MAGQQPNRVPEREAVAPPPQPLTPGGEPVLPQPVLGEGGLVDPRFLSPGPGDAVSTPGRLLEPGVGPTSPEGGSGDGT